MCRESRGITGITLHERVGYFTLRELGSSSYYSPDRDVSETLGVLRRRVLMDFKHELMDRLIGKTLERLRFNCAYDSLESPW